MALTLRATLICDEIRREDNGKLLFVGVYTPNLVVRQLPATLPLCAFQMWDSDSSATHQFRLVIQHMESRSVVLDGSMSIDVPSAGTGFLTLRMGLLRFETEGTYELLVLLDGQDTPAGRHAFEVLYQARN